MSSIPQGPPDVAYLTESRSPEIIAGSLVPFLLASIFVFGRFYSRILILKTWGADDWWILVSWITGGFVLVILNCLLTRYGSGKHIQATTLSEGEVAVKLGFSAMLIYQFTLMTTKFGICAFYSRVFQDRTSKILIWSMAIFVALYSVPLLIAPFFRCHPASKAWSLNREGCANDVPALLASAVFNIVADAGLTTFVLPKIMALKLPTRQKASLIAVLSISILVIVAAIVRIVRIRHVVHNFDVTWDSYDVNIWCSVEINTGLFCVSAPAIKPLVRKLAPGLLSTADSHTSFRTSNLRTRQAYGGGTAISRVRRNSVLELGSQDFSAKSSSPADSTWLDNDARKKSESTIGSERGIVKNAG
ncbi:hypothetical protein BGZ60DRAFT_534287 [Tricladium varicosporioides]|nr:hypothetical protein BGZ60DRAFT_534287 [Hymenoscyphus varicosporioides]